MSAINQVQAQDQSTSVVGLYDVADGVNVADVFSSSQAYTAGQIVINPDDALTYKFITNHAAGVWNSAHVKRVKMAGEFADLKSAVTAIGFTKTAIDISSYTQITGTMQPWGQWAAVSDDRYKSALITDIPKKVTVTPKAGANGAYFSFFNNIPTQPTGEAKEIYFCTGETGRHAVTSTETLTVPEDCVCIVVTVLSGGNNLTPTMVGEFLTGYLGGLENDIESVENSVVELNGKTVTKANATASPNTVILTGNIYYDLNLVVGTTKLSQVQYFGSAGAKAIKIPMTGIEHISYPVFKSQNSGISFFCDAEDTVIWAYTETEKNTGTQKVVKVPAGASYFVLMVSSSLNALDWYYIVSSLKVMSEPVAVDIVTPFANVNRNMCLAGIKTDILTNKIPYHRGFLFHKMANNDGSLWYGADFEHINKIGTVGFNPTLMRFAISPKDGRIIAVQRDTRNGIWIWDGETETHLESFETKPMAWLYNSGVDFINDGTTEYCIFAEYSSSPSAGTVFNVWRGTYPYTSVSDWEIVKTESYDDIIHFHQVRRDPWTDILYLTSGDTSTQSKWWYSTDKGATWTALVSGSDTGWGNSLCRTINFIFTADKVYWATDHGENEHVLMSIERDGTTGVLDLATKTKLCDLPGLRATNSLCYVETPNGLFMYDRVDTAPSSEYGSPIMFKFWDFATSTLKDVVTLGLTSETWGGSRGKCYINYTNSKQLFPAMGFSADTPCIFDLICDNPSNIGTIAFDVGAQTVRTVDY